MTKKILYAVAFILCALSTTAQCIRGIHDIPHIDSLCHYAGEFCDCNYKCPKNDHIGKERSWDGDAVQIITTTVDTFIRFYHIDSTGKKNNIGSWIALKKDLLDETGNLPCDSIIKDHLAIYGGDLNILPNRYILIAVPIGTPLLVGKAAANKSGFGGCRQFCMMKYIPKACFEGTPYILEHCR